jgi:O-acetyl-ADP-ribose deacetylase (regulator of RNase III)
MRLCNGDITQLDVDAIVTAANESLLGGAGVDGAVHDAAGPELVANSRQLAPCPAGEARITPGFRLASSYVIHAVGPIYVDGESGETETLAATYRSALAIAAENGVRTIAFPCISTGAYAFPNRLACRTAIDTVIAWLRENELPEIVTFCCFETVDENLYTERLEEVGIP